MDGWIGERKQGSKVIKGRKEGLGKKSITKEGKESELDVGPTYVGIPDSMTDNLVH